MLVYCVLHHILCTHSTKFQKGTNLLLLLELKYVFFLSFFLCDSLSIWVRFHYLSPFVSVILFCSMCCWFLWFQRLSSSARCLCSMNFILSSSLTYWLSFRIFTDEIKEKEFSLHFDDCFTCFLPFSLFDFIDFPWLSGYFFFLMLHSFPPFPPVLSVVFKSKMLVRNSCEM